MTADAPPSASGLQRDGLAAVRLRLGGRVQGVGFRPFVYRLARELGVQGWVRNELGQVSLQLQAPPGVIARFQQALIDQAPPLARPVLLETTQVAVTTMDAFRIEASEVPDSPASIHLPADYYLCPDCERELLDPANRRYRYPFINCTQCGPRYTLIKRLPYDRANTGMAEFTLCPECRREYLDPADRRFHAEPIACPACGPQLQYYDPLTGMVAETESALAACVAALVQGQVVAVKGIGGYHLMCDAGNDAAVRRLRQRKGRPDKPLAVMFAPTGADGLDGIRAVTRLDKIAATQLRDPARPIVLLGIRDNAGLSAQIAPGLDEIGVFLAYSPLHRLLLEDAGRPLVATSANLSGEPVLTNNQEVEQRLALIADGFLHHNRPIERPADDSVYRVIGGRALPLRSGRGIAPMEYRLPQALSQPTLALGGHMKNAIALAWDDRVVISPHIGDLDAVRSLQVFEQVIQDLQNLYRVNAQRLVCDAHPGYASSRWARSDGRPLRQVQHHHAHASTLAGEYPDETRWLVFTWDGTGYGDDGSIWGAETFYGTAGHWQRLASLRPFHLPGGDKAARQPWRSALGLCWEIDLAWKAPNVDTGLLRRAWERQLNSPLCSSAGRLFDAAAALLGICHQASYEAQAPLQLESLARQASCDDAIALAWRQDQTGLWRGDWSTLLPMLLDTQFDPAWRAACWHESFARHILEQCQWFAREQGDFAVGLSGGVFQNRLLNERVLALLNGEGFRVYLAQSLPLNDAGLSYGQIIEQLFHDQSLVSV